MQANSINDVRQMLTQGVERPGLVRKQAAYQLAREIEALTPRRVLAILHGEVSRLWEDEVLAVRAWYRNFLLAEAARADHQAALHRARRAQLDAEDA